MFFSVIIPTYNRAPLLKQAMDSVLRQSFTDFEIIVVDDGSTDDTPAYLNTLGDRVRTLRQANLGPGAARNAGAAIAAGEYLTFLDSDDLWFPWTLETHAKALASSASTMTSGVGIAFQETPPEIPSPPPMETDVFETFFHACTGANVPCGGTPSISLRREAFKKAGGFLEGKINGEDTDLWFRLGTEPGFVRIKSPAIFAQRGHSGNVSSDFKKTLDGLEILLHRERHGIYPGGSRFKWRRRAMLAATVRHASFWAVKTSHIPIAWALYRQTFSWQLRLGRGRFIAAFPLIAFSHAWLHQKRHYKS
jgi:glycosyltransferase involved in cell wall biosynthesis